MSNILEFDKDLRSVISLFFRLLLVSFALYLVLSHENYFPRLYYYCGFLVYFLVYTRLGKRSKIRLAWDMIFMISVVYGKDLSDVAVVIFLLLPLFNAPNHSSEKRSPILLYSFTFFTFAYLDRTNILTNGIWSYFISVGLPLFLLFLVSLFEFFRTKILRLHESFNFSIDEYYSDELEIGKTHRIFRDILDRLNRSKLIFFKTQKILCLRFKHGNISIVGSSKFITDLKIDDLDNFILDLQKCRIKSDWNIVIDEEYSKKNVSLIYSIGDFQYIFVLITEQTVWPIYKELLIPIFARFTKVLYLESYLYSTRHSYLKKLQNKALFVNEVQSCLHFINNKLGPIENYLEMVEDVRNMPPELKDLADELIEEERGKLRTSMNLIVEKARVISRKGANPFNFELPQKIGLKKLYALLKRNWDEQLSNGDFLTNLSKDDFEKVETIIIEDGLEMLLTNWLSNMRKYQAGQVAAEFFRENDAIVIRFKNNFDISETKKAEAFVRDFNTSNRNEIIQRTRRGLMEIKYLLRELDLECRLNVESELMVFELKFIINSDESSGI